MTEDDPSTTTDAQQDSVTLRDDDLHRPEELDGDTIACTLTGAEAEKRAAWIESELVPHLEAIERRGTGPDSAAGTDRNDGTSRKDVDGETSLEDVDGENGADATGYTLVFAEEALEAVMRFARHEHWCCSFAHFEVHVTPGERPNELSVYGPEGTEELFDEEFVAVMSGEADVGVPG